MPGERTRHATRSHTQCGRHRQTCGRARALSQTHIVSRLGRVALRSSGSGGKSRNQRYKNQHQGSIYTNAHATKRSEARQERKSSAGRDARLCVLRSGPDRFPVRRMPNARNRPGQTQDERTTGGGGGRRATGAREQTGQRTCQRLAGVLQVGFSTAVQGLAHAGCLFDEEVALCVPLHGLEGRPSAPSSDRFEVQPGARVGRRSRMPETVRRAEVGEAQVVQRAPPDLSELVTRERD